MKNYIPALGVFLLALSTAGCGVLSPGDELTEAEAADLALALAQMGLQSGPMVSAQQAPGAEAARITMTINETESCEGGGSAATVGSATVDVNEQTGAGSMSFTLTVTPTNCGVRTASGKVFRLTGDPNLGVSGQFTFTQTSFDGTVNQDGRFKWAADDGRSGSCSLTLRAVYDFTVGQTSMSGSVSVTATVCGRDVNRSTTITVSS